MRLIHDIQRKGIVTGSSSGPDTEKFGDEKVPLTFPVEVLIVAPGVFQLPDEVIRIEGDARHIRDALEEAIRVIDTLAQLAINENRLDSEWLDEPV